MSISIEGLGELPEYGPSVAHRIAVAVLAANGFVGVLWDA